MKKTTVMSGEVKQHKKDWRFPTIKSLGIKHTLLSGSGPEDANAGDYSGNATG